MSLTRSLTLPLTRALSHAELTQKLGGSFSPYALNPYLLFDARDSMIGTLENPTLDLNPALPETLDVITAVRTGVATYTDESGLIQEAVANTVRVDQTQGAELTPTKFQNFVNTDFNESYWSFYGSVTPVYNYDTAPNDEQEAVRIISPGGVGWPQLQETVQNLTIGQQYTASFYVKSDGTSQIQQSTHLQGLGGGVGFTPTDEWQRVSFTTTATATSHTFVIFTNSSNAPASSYLIWGPQLEEGTTASSFVANTTGSPKFITGATYGPRVPMILVEPSATNRISNSNSFSKGAVSRLGTNFEAPDKTNTAEGYGNIPNNVSDAILLSSSPASVSGNTQYSGSIFVKGIAGKTVKFFVKRSGNGNYVESPAQIITLTGEWQRITGMTITTSSNNTELTIYMLGLTTDTAADEIYIWGAQLEEGSVSTSVIPTSGSAVTRAADNLSITGSAFSDFFNSGGDGTFYAEFTFRDTVSSWYVINGSDLSRRFMYKNPDQTLMRSYDGASPSLDLGNPENNTLHRAALSFNSSEKRGSRNGSAEAFNTHSGTFSTTTSLHIGKSSSGFFQLNGHIKRLIYWPTHSDSL